MQNKIYILAKQCTFGTALNTFAKPPIPYMVLLFHIGKLMMSLHATILQYQISKFAFRHTYIYKSQFIKTQSNSDC